MGSIDWGTAFRGGRHAPGESAFSTGGASHLIRSAERLAASGRFDFAIEQLAVAQRLDPTNLYIQAIADRIRVQQNLSLEEKVTLDASSENQGKLDITVGPQFVGGLRSREDDQRLAPEDIPTKIRFLTNLADKYLENGSSEKAFDSLMRAYLLDPLSPYVIAAEKTVLPAWEILRSESSQRNGNRSDAAERESDNVSNIGASHMTPPNSNSLGSPFSSQPSQPVSSAEEQLRMEILKQQKEQERSEKERTVWREASKAPRVFGEDDPANNPGPQQQTQEQTKPQPTGLFSRLRLGKFLE